MDIYTASDNQMVLGLSRQDRGDEINIGQLKRWRFSYFHSAMERVVSRDNLFAALHYVKHNKGCAGIDGIAVDDLPDFSSAIG